MSAFEITLHYEHKDNYIPRLTAILDAHHIPYDTRQLINNLHQGKDSTVRIDQKVLAAALVQLRMEGRFSILPERFNDIINFHTTTKHVSGVYQVAGTGRAISIRLSGTIAYKVKPGHTVTFSDSIQDRKIKQELECGIRSMIPNLEVQGIAYNFNIQEAGLNKDTFMEEALFWAGRHWAAQNHLFVSTPDPLPVFDSALNTFVFPPLPPLPLM